MTVITNDPTAPDRSSVVDSVAVSDVVSTAAVGNDVKDNCAAMDSTPVADDTYAASMSNVNVPVPQHTPLHRFLADPSPVIFDDPRYANQYFLYATEDGFDDWGSHTFHVYTSPDLIEWTDGGQILDLHDVPWGHEHAWAPAVCEYEKRFYLYFVCEGQIGAAVADSPFGPFVSTAQPLIAKDDFPVYPIDPAVFHDDDGTDWLLWGNGTAYMAPLNMDHVSIDRTRVTHWVPGDFREALWIFKRNGVYYASWSENDAREPEYCVKYATGPSVTGPWTEHGVLIEQNPADGIVGTGHHGVIHVPDTDEWILAYHLFDAGYGSGYRREIAFAPLQFHADGTIERVVPTDDWYRRPLA